MDDGLFLPSPASSLLITFLWPTTHFHPQKCRAFSGQRRKTLPPVRIQFILYIYEPSVERGQVERGLLPAVLDVGVGRACLQQDAHGRQVAVARGAVQSGLLVGILKKTRTKKIQGFFRLGKAHDQVGVGDGGPVREEGAHDLRVARPRRQVEGRAAFIVRAVRRSLVAQQQLNDVPEYVNCSRCTTS